jgi:hypothetical protein
MEKQEVIALLENAFSYAESCPDGKWKHDLFVEAATAALRFLYPDSLFLEPNEADEDTCVTRSSA